jgi:ATP-binding cassette subfamily F protein uup
MRGARARTTKQKARIQRAEEAIAAPTPQEALRAKLEATATRTGNTILELHGVGLDLGGRTLIEDLTLHMVKGDRIGVVGPNGAGKTSLLKIVSGELEPTRGRVVRGANTKLAYFDQARANLVDEWSIFDNVAEREGAERTGAGIVKVGDRSTDLRTYLEQFLFDPKKQRQKVGSLSGGERARVALAKLLKTGSNLLLLDEPTNDLDIATLGALEEMLMTWPGCALVVTHDRYFLNRVATSILGFHGQDGEVVRYPGDYDAYRAAADAAKAAARTPPKGPGQETASKTDGLRTPKTSRAPSSQASGKPLTHRERIELDGILELIGQAEAALAGIERDLADPSLYAAHRDRLRELNESRSRSVSRIADLTSRWEALEARRDVKR